ncbi:hypothetical protein AK812_SmicGene24424 [Symbiodinium microadriaticum]|uniref:Endonuclease/exonuclease/phosphatase domain-containing protein n=1 Tax=Symbiodinium microadriaticum TaxID=2951 RepID=A0A1Q9DEJ8_SYMMI|nr:hypothetical protein AK812_SmicGene24424 [Symbiodinium microadriaticum]
MLLSWQPQATTALKASSVPARIFAAPQIVTVALSLVLILGVVLFEGLSKMAWKSCEVLDPRRKFVAMVRKLPGKTEADPPSLFSGLKVLFLEDAGLLKSSFWNPADATSGCIGKAETLLDGSTDGLSLAGGENFWIRQQFHVFMGTQARIPSRKRILSYNVGGMSADLFDVFTEWLDTQEIADIIVLQEIHHGMGRGDNTWTRGAWHFVATSDPANRYAGVCICISAKLAAAANLEHRVIIPGSLVHVRIQGSSLPVDVVGVYQWVKHSRSPDGNVANRSRLWAALGHLLAALPRRNVLALAGSTASTSCEQGARQQTLAGKPELKTTIAHMWQAYHQWKHSQRSRTARGNVFEVWRHYAAFKAASKSLRSASIRVRRQRLHDLINQATVAAARDQMSELYRITKVLAPKQRKERVVIRASDGQMLRPDQQFQAILQYFTNAFSDPTPFRFSPDVPAPVIQPEACPELFAQKDDACSLCSSAGLSTSAPCKYCGEQYKDQRAHLKRPLPKIMEVDAASVARRELDLVWGKRDKEADKRTSVDGQDQEKEEQPSKWPKPSSKGYYGKGQQGWNRWDKDTSQSSQDPPQLDSATTHLLRTLTKMTLRMEEEIGRYRADTGFMLFVDTMTEQNTLQLLKDAGQSWQEQFEAGTVTTSLRIVLFGGLIKKLRDTLQEVLTDDALRGRLMTMGWLQARQQVKDERPPLAHDQVMHCIDVLMKTALLPEVLLRFRTAHKQGQETKAEVVPFKLAVSLRGQASMDCFTALSTLSYCGALKLLGLRLRPERMQKSAMAAELEEAYLSVPYTDWTRRPQRWTSLAQKAKEGPLAAPILLDMSGKTAALLVPPALTMAPFQEIVDFAHECLDQATLTSYLHYIEGLKVLVGQADGVLLPPPIRCPGADAPLAERMAWTALQHRHGFLWPLVREVVSQLPFEQDSRAFARGLTFVLGLYGKGGLLGFRRHTKLFGNVCRLLNQLVYTTWTAHTWTSLAIGVNNHTQPHVDRWNRDSNALLIGLTHHTEGGLWVEGAGGTCYEEFEDVMVAGHVLATSGAGGNRIVLIAYSVGRASYMSEATATEELSPDMPPYMQPRCEPETSGDTCAVELSTAGCSLLPMVTGTAALTAEFRMADFMAAAAAMSKDFGEWKGSISRFGNLSACMETVPPPVAQDLSGWLQMDPMGKKLWNVPGDVFGHAAGQQTVFVRDLRKATLTVDLQSMQSKAKRIGTCTAAIVRRDRISPDAKSHLQVAAVNLQLLKEYLSGILNARETELSLGLDVASHGRLVLSGKKPLVALASSGLEAPDAREAFDSLVRDLPPTEVLVLDDGALLTTSFWNSLDQDFANPNAINYVKTGISFRHVRNLSAEGGGFGGDPEFEALGAADRRVVVTLTFTKGRLKLLVTQVEGLELSFNPTKVERQWDTVRIEPEEYEPMLFLLHEGRELGSVGDDWD